MLGYCEVTKYFEKYSCFICLFTDNFLFKQSFLWGIKTNDQSSSWFMQNNWLYHRSLTSEYICNLELPLCIKLQLEKRFTNYKPFLKELSLVEVKVV